MYGSSLGDDEDDFFEIISELEKKFINLTPYFSDDFELVYFTYNAEYSVSMWKYQNGILSNNSDWIGYFCSSCDDIDDENPNSRLRILFPNSGLRLTISRSRYSISGLRFPISRL